MGQKIINLNLYGNDDDNFKMNGKSDDLKLIESSFKKFSIAKIIKIFLSSQSVLKNYHQKN